MLDILNGKDEQDFSDPETIDTDFILLAYGDTTNKMKQDFIGTSSNRRILKTITYSNKENVGKKEHLKEFDDEIVHIIPCDFNETGNLGYILVFKKNENQFFKISFYDAQNSEIVEIGESDRLPFLYSHDKWKNTILLQKEDISTIYYYDNKELLSKERDFPRLSKNHSSGFIDVDGDLIADIVFISEEDSQKENKKYLVIYKPNSNRQYEESQRIEIHEKSGPVIFSDFNRSGSVDIAYISDEKGDYNLNILLNTKDFRNKKEKSSKKIKNSYTTEDSEYYKRINLNNLFPGMRPRLESKKYSGDEEKDRIATGIFACDIDLNSYIDLILIFDDIKDPSKSYVKILENKFGENKSFEPFKYQLKQIDNLISVSVCDYAKTGREGIIINAIHNAEYKLIHIENNTAKNSYWLTVLTISPNQDKKSYGSYVPGVSYRYYIEEKKMNFIGNQLPQSSFLHLQRYSVFFGLGVSNYLIDGISMGGPSSSTYSQIYRVDNKIIPNSDLVLRPQAKQLGVELFLRLGKHAQNIFIVLVLVLFLNVMFVLYSYKKEKREIKKQNKKQAYLFNFAAI